jgi:hypothetical protein
VGVRHTPELKKMIERCVKYVEEEHFEQRVRTAEGFRRIRSNQELMELYKSPGLVAYVKRRMLVWLGHVIGMYQARLAMDGWWK